MDKEKNKTKPMWQFPWRYRESIICLVGLMVVGLSLQVTVGKFDFALLSSPINLILGCCILVFLGLFAFARKTQFYQWFSGVPFSVTLIACLLILGLAMGLIPQMAKLDPHAHDVWTLLGLRQVTCSWAFVLIYFVTLLSLGSLIVRRLLNFKWQDYTFYLNHMGLWILLFAGGLGAADIKRYVMHVEEGEMEWRVFSDNEDVLDLPVAIRLNDFDMDEYAPKLTIIHRETGEAQPVEKPDYFQIDTIRPLGSLADWDIKVKQYIHQAIRNSDSSYHEVPMPGACPAVLIEVHNKKLNINTQGWVCCGNIAQLYKMLPLTDEYAIVMTQPEPKRFVSDIDVFTEDGAEAHALLEVNKPLSIGDWTVYQYSYDTQAGKASKYSSFELVYDPWLLPVYVGIALFALGAIGLFWSGNKKKGENNDVE
ncbi:MAG: hypothetical protein RL662_602 [Bacteroidota bacterium]|jgi:hypothetical protein